MKYFEPHIHMFSRTTDDYENMAEAGIIGVVEPSFWQGQPRNHIGSFIDYYDLLLGWERFRASQFGIRHYCAIGLNPKEANNIALAKEVLAIIPRYLAKDGVVAIGEIGYDDITPAEDEALLAQLEMSKTFGLPILIHTPHRDKINGTKRTLDVIREAGVAPEMVLVDHLNEVTLPMAKDRGVWLGHSLYPQTKMSEIRMVELLKQFGSERMVVNSAADWGKSDPLKVPKLGQLMLASGYSEAEVKKVLFKNPIEFYAQSGRISIAEVRKPKIDQSLQWQENSALRGQNPIVEI